MRRKFISYTLIGGANTVLYFSFLLALSSTGAPITLTNPIAFSVAAFLSFLVNTKITFKISHPWPNLLTYLVAMSVLALVIGLLADFLSLGVWVAGGLSIISNAVISFGMLTVIEARSK